MKIKKFKKFTVGGIVTHDKNATEMLLFDHENRDHVLPMSKQEAEMKMVKEIDRLINGLKVLNKYNKEDKTFFTDDGLLYVYQEKKEMKKEDILEMEANEWFYSGKGYGGTYGEKKGRWGIG